MMAPLPVSDVFQIIRTLLEQPRTRLVEPGARHAQILEKLAVENQAAGALLTDALLATLAVEHGATLASTDRGFAELAWVNPLVQ